MAFGIIAPKATSRPPGTELLVDNASSTSEQQSDNMHVKHAKGAKTNIILIPQPSSDPNDPLLWPTWKREAAFATLFLNCILFATCPGPMIAPATIALSTLLTRPVTSIAQLSGYQLLVVGALGPPTSLLATKFGKRAPLVISALLGTLGTAICVAAFSAPAGRVYDVLLAGRMVQGLGTTAYESLSVAAIGDLFFLHERGGRTAWVVLTLACLSSAVSIVAGVLYERLGARALFVVLLPVQVGGLLGAVVFLPEMQFRRGGGGGGGGVEEVGGEREEVGGKGEEKMGSEVRGVGSRGGDEGGSTPRKRTFWQDLRLTSGTYSPVGFGRLFADMFVHLLNPAVVWVQLVSAVLVSLFVGTAYTLAQIFTPPPYSLSVAQNGYFFTGALIGGILGVAAGPLCDYTARYLARKNHGVYEAEFRIPVCGLTVVVFAVGWFTFGWALDHPTYERVYLCSFCYGAVCFGTSVASTSGGLYVLDAFKEYSTEIFILQMMIKNFLFYAFSTFFNDFVAEKGAGHMCRVWGIVTVCGFTTCVPMYVFGKVNRHWVHRLWKKYLGKE